MGITNYDKLDKIMHIFETRRQLKMVQSAIHKNRHMILFGSIGTAAMLLSVLGGETFLSTQNELASYLMSFGFLTGMLSLNWGFFTQKAPTESLPQGENLIALRG
jgi:hypothetical protein